MRTSGKKKRKSSRARDLTRWGSLVQSQSSLPFNASRVIKIPKGFAPYPAVTYRNGRFRMFLVIAPEPRTKRDFSVTPRRRKAG